MSQTYTDEQITAMIQDSAPKNQPITDAEMTAMIQNEAEKEKYNNFASAGVGAADLATMGYGPNIIAGVKTGSMSSPEYIKERDGLNKTINQMKEEDPGSFLTGQVLGGVATSLLPGASAVKGATLISKIGRAAVIGGSMGAIADTPDPLDRTASPFSKEDVIERGTNTAFGMAAAPLAEIGVSGIKKMIPNSVNRAFTALQPDKAARKEIRLAEEKGGSATKENIVKFAKDEGILEGLPDVKTIYSRSLDLKKKYGQELSSIYKKAQEVVDSIMHESGFDPKNMEYELGNKNLEQIKNKLVRSIEDKDWADADRNKAIKQISNYFDGIKDEFGLAPDLLQLHELKTKIGEKAFTVGKANSPRNTEKFWREAGRAIDDEIKNRVDGLAEIAGKSSDKNLGNMLRDSNKKFSFTSKVYDMAAQAVDSQVDNIPSSIFDAIPNLLKSPGVQMGLSNVGKVIESGLVPKMTGTEIGRAAAMGYPSPMRAASQEELMVPPPNPFEIDRQIKSDNSLTPSQKAKLRNENMKQAK